MRFKVKTGTPEAYADVVTLLEDRQVPVFVCSPKRRYVSIGEIPSEIRSAIQAFGGEIVPETWYAPD